MLIIRKTRGESCNKVIFNFLIALSPVLIIVIARFNGYSTLQNCNAISAAHNTFNYLKQRSVSTSVFQPNVCPDTFYWNLNYRPYNCTEHASCAAHVLKLAHFRLRATPTCLKEFHKFRKTSRERQRNRLCIFLRKLNALLKFYKFYIHHIYL